MDHHLVKVGAFLATVFLLYTLVLKISLQRSRAALKQATGAQSAKPYPQWERIVGWDAFRDSLKAFREHRMLVRLEDRFKETGSTTFSIVVLGRKTIMTLEPQNLKVIQALDHKKWGLGQRRVTAFKPLLGNGIFTNDGADWAHSREMLRPNFVRSQIGDVATFERHVAHLISKLPLNGSTVNLADFFFRLTMDSATEFLFGESTDSLSKDSEDGFAGAFNRSQDNIAMRSRFGPWVKRLPFLFDLGSMDKDQKFVHDFVDYYVEKACAKRDQQRAEKQSEKTSDRYIFIDEIVSQTDDRTRIRDECLNILLAGRDTTASLLTNVWWLLSKRQDLWTKLQTEVASLDGAHPTFEQLKDLKFLRAFLNETLRLYPVVPQNSREAQEDTTLPVGGGPDGASPLFVPKGGVVGWSVYAMHRRTDYYGADAEEFKPERWLDDPASGTKGLRPSWEYLPFNGGARICLGQQFALTEASYTTVRLCQAFSAIESRDPGNVWREKINLTCVNLDGAKVALTAR